VNSVAITHTPAASVQNYCGRLLGNNGWPKVTCVLHHRAPPFLCQRTTPVIEGWFAGYGWTGKNNWCTRLFIVVV